jgi:hypothetical protein
VLLVVGSILVRFESSGKVGGVVLWLCLVE